MMAEILDAERARGSAWAVAAAAVAILALLPLVTNEFVLHVLTVSFYYVILAACWNLLAGYTGQFSLAQQSFATIGAYTTGLLIHDYGIPIWQGIVFAVISSTIAGLALGVMTVRMRAIYLAIATWAFAQTLQIVLTAAHQITRGHLGLSLPPIFAALAPRPYYWLLLTVAVAALLIVYGIVRSPIGTIMRAIKDDELRAQSLGIDTTLIKVFVFAVTSGLSGLAGAFYAHDTALLSPQMAGFSEIGKIITMVMIGGLGTFAGPLIGAPIIQLLGAYLQPFGEWDLVIYALLVIVVMRAYKGGL
ncbi:MAG: branched-chain amino acid ABC transporter permease, partial [bacterium]|nr:branched-chain amino acid ABC transporter permease [bacterium]